MGASAWPRPWIPVGLACLAIGTGVVWDWQAHEFPAHTLRFTVHHPLGIRLAVHGLAVTAMVALLVSPRRAWLAWFSAVMVTLISSLATTRVVFSPQEPVRVVVAGALTIESIPLEEDPYDRGRRCYRSLTHDKNEITVNGRRLRPPFLPLPVDRSVLDGEAIEYKCTR